MWWNAAVCLVPYRNHIVNAVPLMYRRTPFNVLRDYINVSRWWSKVVDDNAETFYTDVLAYVDHGFLYWYRDMNDNLKHDMTIILLFSVVYYLGFIIYVSNMWCLLDVSRLFLNMYQNVTGFASCVCIKVSLRARRISTLICQDF